MMIKASSMRWYGHVLRRKDQSMILMVLKFEGRCSRERPKQTWKKQSENETKKMDWKKSMRVIEQNIEA